MSSQKNGQDFNEKSRDISETASMEDQGYLIFRFHDYQDWAEDLDGAVWTFGMRLRTFPKIMLASNTTYDRIDEVAKEFGFKCCPIPIDCPPFEGAPEGEQSFFTTLDYRIRFVSHDEIPEDHFVLMLVHQVEDA